MAQTEPRLPATDPGHGPARILIVDDLAANLLALEAVLEEPGVTLVRAASAREAIARLQEHEFALVILDVRMPDMDGFSAIRQIRGYRQLREIPIIFVSAFEPSRDELEQLYDLGAVDFVAKPINAAVVRAKARVFLELHRSRTDLARRVAERTTELERQLLARAQTETALRQSEARLRLLVEQVPAVQWTTDHELRITVSVGSGLAALGLKPGQLVGTRVSDFVGPGDPSVEAHRQALRGERATYQGVYAGRRFESYVEPLRNAAGGIVGVVGVGFDRTERHAAEELSARLSAIVASSDDAIVSKNLEGIVTSWNAGAERIFGYTAAEMVGRSITTLIPEDRMHEEREILEKIGRGERVDHFESIRRRKDGRVIAVSLTISPMRAADGRVIGASKIARDISERRRWELRQAVLAELSKVISGPLDFRKRLESIPGMLASEFADWCVIDLLRPSGKLERALTGHRNPEVGAFARDWVKPVELDLAAPAGAAAVLRTGQPEFHPELTEESLRAIGQDAGHVDFLRELRATSGLIVLLQADGRKLGALLLVRCGDREPFDLLDLETAQAMADRVAMALHTVHLHERLEALNLELEARVLDRTRELEKTIQELETFSYTVAHDLRAPLRTMTGFSELLLEEAGEALSEEGKEAARRIAGGAARMDALTLGLLEYARVAQARVQVERIDLDQVVAEVLQELGSQIRDSSASVEVLSPLGCALGSLRLLTQALANLVTNACKFVESGKRPRVEIRSERRGGRIRITVRDWGIGIEPRHRAKLYGMFERLEPGRFPGTGIGLAIVKKAAERMAGGAGFDSEPGQGSRFWIELPDCEETLS